VAWLDEGSTEVCLDLAGADTTNGNYLQIWPCNGLQNQQWFFDDWQIKSVVNDEKCIDIPGEEELGQGTYLQIWDCNGLPNQGWGYDYDAMSIFASNSAADATLCMDIPGSSSDLGTRIWVWSCDHDIPGQQWWVPPQFGSYNIQIGIPDTFACLDLAGQNTNNGSPVQVWDCNGFESQQWLFQPDTWNIVYAADTSKCLDVPGSSFTAGNKLWIWDCNGSDGQKFGADGDSYSIFAASSADASMCLDVPGGSAQNGAQVWLWDCNGGSNQRWWIPDYSDEDESNGASAKYRVKKA